MVCESRGGAPGFDLRLPRASAAAVTAALTASGIADAPWALLEASRVEAGIPRWGAELGASVLPNEALLERDAISYTKGCYIGQETVARIRTYGHVNRLLVRLALPEGTDVSPGDEVTAGGGAIGAVTSVARDTGAALAFVKRDHARDGETVQVSSHPASVHPIG
jgi:folate-binding protein YgfZ